MKHIAFQFFFDCRFEQIFDTFNQKVFEPNFTSQCEDIELIKEFY